MEGIVCKKKEATGAVGYCILFGLALILVITTMYIAMASKLMSEQHTIDDALSDSVLASLVADDVYYFETAESYEKIFVSAGRIGAQIELFPQDLVTVANAKYAKII